MPVHSPPGEREVDQELLFVGRERELSLLDAQLERARGGEPRLVSIEGPAGIGKTALVRRFLAKFDDACVLRASGEENESLLPYGVLVQLAGPLDTLPGELGGSGAPVHPLAVGSALLDVLGDVQDQGVVVIVVDDAHWADIASLHALAFAFRRLRVDHVLALVISRDATDSRLPEGLRRVLADDDTLKLSLDGLETAELRALSRGFSTAPLTQRAAARLRQHTDGNPLHARALLEQIPAEVLGDPHSPWPAPRSYELLVLARLAVCRDGGRALVEAASVLSRTCALHEAAKLGAIDDPLQALEEAVTAGLLIERPGTGGVEVGFAHPLVQAAVYQSLGPARRARLHLDAAELVDGDLARLRHRLRAADRPDWRLASELADLGRRNAAQGLWAGAAEHMVHAARLAVTADDRVRLTAEAVEALLFDGQIAEASKLTAGLSHDDTDPGVRGYAQGAVATATGRSGEAVMLLTEAWWHCNRQAEPAMAARIAEQLTFNSLMQGRGPDGVLWAERALELAPHRPGADLIRTHHLLGLVASGKMARALEITASPPDPSSASVSELDGLLGRGLILIFADQFQQAVHELAGVVAAYRNRSLPFRLAATAMLSLAEYHLGRWDDAVIHAEAATSVAADADQVWLGSIAHGVAALVPAARGEWERAEGHVRATRSGPTQSMNVGPLVAAATGQVHLAAARGDDSTTVPAMEILLELGKCVLDPSLVPWHDRLLDLLVAEGDHERAEAALLPFEELAAGLGRHSAQATAARVRGNLEAARHNHAAADAAYQAGLGHALRVDGPFDLARLDLDYGAYLRRRSKRAMATDRLQSALAAFERLGARPYLERCETELAACGRRPALRRGADAAQLTPQEQAVARLVAGGLTNRQVAGELVLSVKTVEYHLAHVYTKLAVNSRAGLATKLLEEPLP